MQLAPGIGSNKKEEMIAEETVTSEGFGIISLLAKSLEQ
jgi:hypothetical protein